MKNKTNEAGATSKYGGRRHGKLSNALYSLFRWLIIHLYPKTRMEGIEKLPGEPCIIVGNHSQMHGPIIGELFFPGDKAIWCAGQMMDIKTVPAYAYKDFWSYKPKGIRWFYRILSYIIAPISQFIFNHAHTIAVYRDNRSISTFKQTIRALNAGSNIIIFPECYEPHNSIVYDFQKNFVDIARFYYKRTGKCLQFVPVYIAPELATVYICQPTRYQPGNEIVAERARVCNYLMDSITDTAESLPRHIVVPYKNISRRDYSYSIPLKETDLQQ